MMKLSTLTALAALTDDAAILAELNAEIEKATAAENAKAAKAAARAEVYEAAWEYINGAMSTDEPQTVATIYATACANGLPQNFSKNQISYGLTHDWVDRVNKIEGKVNAYTLAA